MAVTHDLRVMGAEQCGDDLVIDLYGGPSNACGSVRFTFTNSDEREQRYSLVRYWFEEQMAVALVADEQQITLVDERRLTNEDN